MQISDYLIQYQNNLATGSEPVLTTKGIEQLVETAKTLQVGSIFEGTVNDIKGNQVTLGLSSGQNITARLESGIKLTKGQSVFFQVKTNDEQMIRIKPVSLGGSVGNPTLSTALDSAGLPVNERNLNMVNTMMKEQMSIDSQSLQAMSRNMIQAPSASAQTVVEMEKIGLPVTDSMAAEYENYKSGQAQVLPEITNLSNTITDLVNVENADIAEVVSFQKEVATILLGDEMSQFQMEVDNMQPEAQTMTPTMTETVSGQMTEEVVAGQQAEEGVAGQIAEETPENSLQLLSNRTQIFSQELMSSDSYPKNTLGNTLSTQDFVSLQKSFSELPEFVQNSPELFTEDGQLRPEAETTTLVAKLTTYLETTANTTSKQAAQSILSQDGYKDAFDNVLKQAFSLSPEEITEEGAVAKLYEKITEKISQMDLAAQQILSKGADTVSNATNSIQQNIEFMQEVNQLYSFVQIPIKLANQDTNADLYVFRNKRQKPGEDETLTAFLHFDMDHLGSMDISVKMLHKNVTMNWLFDTDEIVDFMSANIHFLSERLEEKGYTCNISVEGNASEKEIDFVKDFLKAEDKSVGEVHRYSFDVRA